MPIHVGFGATANLVIAGASPIIGSGTVTINGAVLDGTSDTGSLIAFLGTGGTVNIGGPASAFSSTPLSSLIASPAIATYVDSTLVLAGTPLFSAAGPIALSGG